MILHSVIKGNGAMAVSIEHLIIWCYDDLRYKIVGIIGALDCYVEDV